MAAPTAEIKSEILYQSGSFSFDSLGNYTLTCHLSMDEAFCVISKSPQEVLYVATYKNVEYMPPEAFIDSLVRKEDSLRKRFRQVEVLVDTPRWLLLPVEFTPDGAQKDYLESFYGIGKTPYVYLQDTLPYTSAAYVYAIPAELEERLKVLFPSASYSAYGSRIILASGNTAATHFSTFPIVGSVYLYHDRLFYTLFVNSNLYFFNAFDIAGQEDALYYVHTVNQHVGIGKSDLCVYVAGLSPHKNHILYTFHRFFGSGYKNIQKFLPTPPPMQEKGVFMEDLIPYLPSS
ncbi:MAG: DUF3822 family protein [Bacteroidia bacterium]